MLRHIAFLGMLVVLAGLCDAQAESRFYVGGSYFTDHYEEPSATVDTRTNYTSGEAGYEHHYNNYWSAIDGRYSWGKSDYKSVSGVLNGTPEFETDLRLRTGIDIVWWHGVAMPYVGLGWRYYFDQGKGRATNLGLLAYDRHISQAYMPVGVTYRFSSGAWNFRPNIELDALIYGRVSTHLAPIGVDDNVVNTQRHGYGIRSEFMVGQEYKYFGWEAGPFVRYWSIKDSDCKVTTNSAPGACLLEPKNTRMQAGGTFRLIF